MRRQHAKGDTPFVEVFVNAPLAEAEKRDPKGLYKKARAGFIHDFTGVSAPYDAPEAPEVELRTDLLSIEESAKKLFQAIVEAGQFREGEEELVVNGGGGTEDVDPLVGGGAGGVEL